LRAQGETRALCGFGPADRDPQPGCDRHRNQPCRDHLSADIIAIDKAFQDHYARGNYSAAQIEAQKLERMAKARFGGDHPYYAVALNRLGIVVQAQGKYTEAEELYKRALVIREKALPSAWPRPVRGASPPPRPSPPTSNALPLRQSHRRYGRAEHVRKGHPRPDESRFPLVSSARSRPPVT
jgi:tetratricopeptide (TPR) repeat protein